MNPSYNVPWIPGVLGEILERRNSETSRNFEGKGEAERACRGMRDARKKEFWALEGVIESHGGGLLAATRGP